MKRLFLRHDCHHNAAFMRILITLQTMFMETEDFLFQSKEQTSLGWPFFCRAIAALQCDSKISFLFFCGEKSLFFLAKNKKIPDQRNPNLFFLPSAKSEKRKAKKIKRKRFREMVIFRRKSEQ